MAQTGYTPISLYYSTTAAAAPTAGNLVNGELGLNITDGKLYYKDNAGVVQLLAAKGGTPGGSAGQVQFNNSGAFGGVSDGTTGQVLTFQSAGSAPTWADPTGAVTPFLYTLTTISTSTTLPTGENALTIGPVTVQSGVTVTVPSGQRWVVI